MSKKINRMYKELKIHGMNLRGFEMFQKDLGSVQTLTYNLNFGNFNNEDEVKDRIDSDIFDISYIVHLYFTKEEAIEYFRDMFMLKSAIKIARTAKSYSGPYEGEELLYESVL